MAEKVAPPAINITEQITSEQRLLVGQVIKTAMETEKANPGSSIEGWHRHVGENIAPLVSAMMERADVDGRPSIWQVAYLFNLEDPEKSLWGIDLNDRQLVLGFFLEQSGKVWDEKELALIEGDLYTQDGYFDPNRLKIDFFSIAREGIKALKEQGLLPTIAKTAEMDPMVVVLPAELALIARGLAEKKPALEILSELHMKDLFEGEGVEVPEVLESLLKHIGGLEAKVRSAEEKKGLDDKERGIIQEFNRVKEGVKRMEMLDRIAVQMLTSGSFQENMIIGETGRMSSLFTYLFPELQGFGTRVHVARNSDGNLIIDYSGFIPFDKAKNHGRMNVFRLPIKTDDKGKLQSLVDDNGLAEIWKNMKREVRQWIEFNLSQEEFNRRLKDPHLAIIEGITSELGRKRAFLQSGSLKFSWDQSMKILTISGQKDDRNG
ncbi:MAG: hypothetical protein V1810_02910 [Candidatus Beckwithbacteria bacterium]